MNNFTFKDKKLGEYDFNIDQFTFVPTQTSNCIIHAALKVIDKPGNILDLGCGCGVVAILLDKHLNYEMNLNASDLSETVVSVVTSNAKKYGCYINVKKGSIFDGWEGHKFNYIINDISGVSEEVAKISPWFKNISCEAGRGGNLLVNQVLENARDYLKPNGKLIFPIISFSDKKEILNKANKIYENVELIERQEWPAPDEMMKHFESLENLKNEGFADYRISFGKLIGYTEIYGAY